MGRMAEWLIGRMELVVELVDPRANGQFCC